MTSPLDRQCLRLSIRSLEEDLARTCQLQSEGLLGHLHLQVEIPLKAQQPLCLLDKVVHPELLVILLEQEGLQLVS
jgi:hypothetical protein